MNGYLPPHVHMHLCRTHVVTKRVRVTWTWVGQVDLFWTNID